MEIIPQCCSFAVSTSQQWGVTEASEAVWCYQRAGPGRVWNSKILESSLPVERPRSSKDTVTQRWEPAVLHSTSDLTPQNNLTRNNLQPAFLVKWNPKISVFTFFHTASVLRLFLCCSWGDQNAVGGVGFGFVFFSKLKRVTSTHFHFWKGPVKIAL